MQIRSVLVHTCNQRIDGFIQRRCRCRKYMTPEEASELINNGYAANVIESVKTIQVEEACAICAGVENLKKSCDTCKNSGVVSKNKLHVTYGTDIFMRPFLKTPRTATVEAEHLDYAYVKGDKDALKRIELYDELTQLSLAELGATLINSRTKEVVVPGTSEPQDDPRTATGRRFDYGRSI